MAGKQNYQTGKIADTPSGAGITAPLSVLNFFNSRLSSGSIGILYDDSGLLIC